MRVLHARGCLAHGKPSVSWVIVGEMQRLGLCRGAANPYDALVFCGYPYVSAVVFGYAPYVAVGEIVIAVFHFEYQAIPSRESNAHGRALPNPNVAVFLYV